ncbi:MMPL family transporter [Rhodococcus globerulus]|uniref:MMPL family transporter n=1 Tax=Rhodococcus globerulus TaxID=33008 RepID=UPI001F3D9D38|nr:MMPL family transporter [Rhodococcus globerulus]MCE4267300.1 MMPL family transporter [Rhodococcus globerulus]
MPLVLAWIGRFSARHRLLVVLAWLLALFALASVLVSGGSSEESASASIPDTRASQAMEVMNQKFPSTGQPERAPGTVQLVMQTTGGASVTDTDVRTQIDGLLDSASTVADVVTVSDPFDSSNPFVSADMTTAVSTVIFAAMDEDQQHAAYDAILALADTAPNTLVAEVGGQLFEPATSVGGIGEIAGVLVAFVVLFLTFGSLLAAGANMLVALSGVAVGTLGVLAYGTISPIEPTTITLGTMLGLAVGIDYSLFILTRFRAELRDGHSVEKSVGKAVGTAGTAVVFAGLTVIIALAGLRVVGISFITDMGMGGAFGVLVAVLMSLTLLPVLMHTLGLRALPRKERHIVAAAVPAVASHAADEKRSSNAFFAAWVGFLVRRPIISIIAGIGVLLIVAIPMLGMKTAQNVPGGLDPSSTQRHAYDLIVEEFGGIQSPLMVIAEGDNATNTAAVQEQLAALDGVQSVDPGVLSADGTAALFRLVPTGGPIDESTENLVDNIRDRADMAPGVHLEVTGETAIGIDMDAALHQALIKYVVVIVLLSFVLLTIMFRSLLVPLIATLGYLLSVGAAFGGSGAVFQWGWLDAIIPAPQGDPMLSVLPIILVGVLFGLAMDYQVFLVSRIQEMHSRGLSPKDAVISGFKTSGPVLVAAAAIMVFVFAGFATSTMAVAASIAFGLVVGVLADAFIVRMILMPAMLALLGKSAWWLPRWLDKIMPDLDIEGRALDEHPDAKSEGNSQPTAVLVP